MPRTPMLVRKERVVGIIEPDCLYTLEGCLRYAGIGEKALAEGRQADKLHPVEKSRRLFYKGSELIAWITENQT